MNLTVDQLNAWENWQQLLIVPMVIAVAGFASWKGLRSFPDFPEKRAMLRGTKLGWLYALLLNVPVFLAERLGGLEALFLPLGLLTLFGIAAPALWLPIEVAGAFGMLSKHSLARRGLTAEQWLDERPATFVKWRRRARLVGAITLISGMIFLIIVSKVVGE